MPPRALAGNGIALGGHAQQPRRAQLHGGSRNNGIVVMPPLDRHYWPATGNVIRDNIVLESGRADMAAAGLGTIGNCFSRATDSAARCPGDCRR